MSQVPVYHQYFFSLNGKTHGDVHGQKTFSTTQIKRGFYKYFLLGILAFHKVHVGAKHTKSFVDNIPVTLFHHNCIFRKFILLFFVSEI